MTPGKARPSRTHSLAREALGALLFLAFGILLVAFFAPASLERVTVAYEVLAGSIAALAGVGVGGMAARDAWTGGLTSSSGELVVEAKKIDAKRSTTVTVAEGPPEGG